MPLIRVPANGLGEALVGRGQVGVSLHWCLGVRVAFRIFANAHAFSAHLHLTVTMSESPHAHTHAHTRPCAAKLGLPRRRVEAADHVYLLQSTRISQGELTHQTNLEQVTGLRRGGYLEA